MPAASRSRSTRERSVRPGRAPAGRHGHLPARNRIEAEDGAHHLRPSRAHQSGDAEHFPAAQIEACGLARRAPPARPLTESTTSPASCRVRGGKEILHRPPDHVRHELLVGRIGNPAGGHAPPVPQHRAHVGNLADLLEEVTDVDDAEPLGAQPADQCEQPVHVGPLQAARRLVHQQDPAVGRERAADLHDLLRGNRQLPDDAVRPQLRVGKVREQLARAGVGRSGIDDAPARGLAAHEDVLRHRHVRAERQFLVNERDAVTARVERRRRPVRRPSIWMVPASGGSAPASTFMSVLLPAPFSPMSA